MKTINSRHLPIFVAGLLALFLLGSVARAEPNSDIVAVVLGEDIPRDSRIRPGDRIFSELLARFAANNNIHPTEIEIENYLEKNAAITAQLFANQEIKLARISKELESGSLSQQEIEKLSSQKEAMKRMLNSQSKIATSSSVRDDEEYKIKRTMAADSVQKWKVNLALYWKYGGRVIFQQMGPEPLDAYRKFLREQSEMGAFRILDPKIEEEFWRYFTNDKMHIFAPEQKAEQTMSLPWWEASPHLSESVEQGAAANP